MKKIIVILALALTACNGGKIIDDTARYRFSQEYKMVNGVTTMRTQVITWEESAIVGSEVYDNTIAINGDSIVYYKEVEKLKADAYRNEWFKLNRPGVKQIDVDKD